ncbi:MAG: class F sortase [Acidimicrobiales bacterium]
MALAVLALGLFLVGLATVVTGETAPSAAVRAASPPVAGRRPALAGTPVRVRIPAIGVDARMDGLGLNSDGSLEVPPYDRAGWYQGGAKPGERGPAVIAAHVDSTTGPAVFYRLKRLGAGDEVTVDYDDGTAVDFVVRSAERFAKSAFPTERVYGATEESELRLITCGGSFDRRTHSYLENLVVWATMTSVQALPVV